MLESKDIEIQADFPEVLLKNSIYRKSICFMKGRFSRIKNPLETVSQYKERVFRMRRTKNILAHSIIIDDKVSEMQICGSRCRSVDVAKKKFAYTSHNAHNSSFVHNKERTLPLLEGKFKNVKLRYLNQR